MSITINKANGKSMQMHKGDLIIAATLDKGFITRTDFERYAVQKQIDHFEKLKNDKYKSSSSTDSHRQTLIDKCTVEMHELCDEREFAMDRYVYIGDGLFAGVNYVELIDGMDGHIRMQFKTAVTFQGNKYPIGRVLYMPDMDTKVPLSDTREVNVFTCGDGREYPPRGHSNVKQRPVKKAPMRR